MNTLDAYVTDIVGKPKRLSKSWALHVKYNCEGTQQETKLYFATREEAESILIGHHFTT